MLGLALESAANTASAALCATSTSLTLLGCLELPPKAGKADQLILLVEKLLDDADVGYRDLEFIAVNRGPGSFTGIRSAVALGRGLALATGCPVIGVTTHEALAASLGPDVATSQRRRSHRHRLMIAQDARRGRVYCQCFDADLNPTGDLVDEAPDVAAALLKQGSWQLGGSGARAVRVALDDGVDVTVIDGGGLDARAVALAADRRLSRGENPTPGFDLTPLYVRPPDAVRPKPLVSPLTPTVPDRV